MRKPTRTRLKHKSPKNSTRVYTSPAGTTDKLATDKTEIDQEVKTLIVFVGTMLIVVIGFSFYYFYLNYK